MSPEAKPHAPNVSTEAEVYALQTAGTLDDELSPELFFGIVGAVGTNLAKVEEALAQELRRVEYEPVTIRLSDLILESPRYAALKANMGGPEDKRIEDLMDAGDRVRREVGRGDALAVLAISKLSSLRRTLAKPRRGYAFIFHSLKHMGEIETLRRTYGSAFFALSAYSPRAGRKGDLSAKIASSRGGYTPTREDHQKADHLIDKDEKELNDEFGQSVRDIFPEGDFFVDASSESSTRDQVRRFINILFGHPYTTPTVAEYGMFHAKAAALRSADLARQVGAVIMTTDGEMISAGCNEVPRANGGSVWDGEAEDSDNRDFRLGYDSTSRMKAEIISEIFDRLREVGWLSDSQAKFSIDELVEKSLFNKPLAPLKGTRVASIIEFGRIVHAEMSAITDAARRGLRTAGATLYCTTFPCHMCARHIIACGIERVIYIEPYPKSMAKELYKRSIRVDQDTEAHQDAVVFETFVGVSPRRYLEFFEMTKRKDDHGYVISWAAAKSRARVQGFSTYEDVEKGFVDFVVSSSKKFGMEFDVELDDEPKEKNDVGTGLAEDGDQGGSS